MYIYVSIGVQGGKGLNGPKHTKHYRKGRPPSRNKKMLTVCSSTTAPYPGLK